MRSGDPSSTSYEMLAVWSSIDSSTSVSNVIAQRYMAAAGEITDLGGGCGAGRAMASCAVVGNTSFTLRLQDANAFTSTWLVMSADRLDGPCGPCTFIANPWTGFVFSTGSTNAFGDSKLSLSIPPVPQLAGATFYQQWIQTGSGCSGHEMSNGLEIRIQ